MNIENRLTQYNTTKCSHQFSKITEKISVEIYDTCQNLHHSISHDTSYMVPQRPNNRTTQHLQHHTISHDIHHRKSQDTNNKTPHAYHSIVHDNNHMPSQEPYHRTPYGYYHMISQDSHHETSQYPNTLFHRTVTTRPPRVIDTHRFMQKTPIRTSEGNPHTTSQNTCNRARQHGSHMNILDHHQTLPNRGHGTSYIENQRDYVEYRYDFNELRTLTLNSVQISP